MRIPQIEIEANWKKVSKALDRKLVDTDGDFSLYLVNMYGKTLFAPDGYHFVRKSDGMDMGKTVILMIYLYDDENRLLEEPIYETEDMYEVVEDDR